MSRETFFFLAPLVIFFLSIAGAIAIVLTHIEPTYNDPDDTDVGEDLVSSRPDRA